MSWHDSKSPWVRKARRSAIACGMVGSLLIMFGVAAAGGLIWLNRRAWSIQPIDQPIDWSSFMLPIVILLFFGVFGWLMFLTAWRQSLMIKAVPLHDGGVCPFCRKVMVQSDTASKLHCSRCNVQHDREELQRFWVLSVLNYHSAGLWWAEHHPRRNSLIGRWRRRAFGDRTKRWYIPSAFSVVMLVYFIAAWWWMGTSLLGFVLPLAPMLFALALIGNVLQFSRGDTKRCAQCQYQAAPSDSQQQLRCPECGLDWSSPGGLVVGGRRPLDSIQKFKIGVAAALLMIATASLVVLPNFVHRAIPTSFLMNQVTTGRGFLQQEWDALATRQLSEQQCVVLARGLLQRREERATLEREATQWFFDQHAADSLPSEIIDAFYQGIIKTRLLVPEQVNVGETFSAGIENINRYQAPFPSPLEPLVYFVSYSVNAESNTCCQAEKTMSLISFGSRVHSYGDPAGIDGAGPRMSYTAHEPGPIVVRARFWLAMTPRGGPGSSIQPIQWDEFNKPVFPPGTTWSQEYVLEETVKVVEQAHDSAVAVQEDEQHEPG